MSFFTPCNALLQAILLAHVLLSVSWRYDARMHDAQEVHAAIDAMRVCPVLPVEPFLDVPVRAPALFLLHAGDHCTASFP
jgi:hypothetical protein